MNTKLLSSTLVLLVALPFAGCAKTEPASPDAARAADAMSFENEQSTLQTDQAAERAELRGDQKKDAADTEEDLAKQAAEAKADHTKYDADIKARMDKIDIRMSAIEPKVVKVKGATAAKGILQQVKAERMAVGDAATRQSSMTGAEWDSAKKQLDDDASKLETHLDELEKMFP